MLRESEYMIALNDMLRHIKFGNKFKDIEGIFTYIPYDVTVRDSEGNYIGS